MHRLRDGEIVHGPGERRRARRLRRSRLPGLRPVQLLRQRQRFRLAQGAGRLPVAPASKRPPLPELLRLESGLYGGQIPDGRVVQPVPDAPQAGRGSGLLGYSKMVDGRSQLPLQLSVQRHRHYQQSSRSGGALSKFFFNVHDPIQSKLRRQRSVGNDEEASYSSPQ